MGGKWKIIGQHKMVCPKLVEKDPFWLCDIATSNILIDYISDLLNLKHSHIKKQLRQVLPLYDQILPFLSAYFFTHWFSQYFFL